jgi:D-alanine-D-alanine ligase
MGQTRAESRAHDGDGAPGRGSIHDSSAKGSAMSYRVAVIWAGGDEGDEGAERQARRVREALAQGQFDAYCLRADEGLAPSLLSDRPDVAFPVVSGSLALRADVQSLLELAQVPYVGTSSRMSALATDKSNLPAALAIAAQQDPVQAMAPFTLCLGARAIDDLGVCDRLDAIEARVPGGYPMCVKPARTVQGMGVRRVDDAASLRDALRAAARTDGRVLVQEWVTGMLVSVIVAGDGEDLGVLPPVRIGDGDGNEPATPDRAGHPRQVPLSASMLDPDAELGEAALSQIERDALDSFYACGARDLARVDLVWAGGEGSYVLGVDPCPSFAPGSVLDVSTSAAGITLAELASELVSGAAERG